MVLSGIAPPRMDKDRNRMATRILDLALEIISLITGEDYTVVKKSSDECVTPSASGGRSRTQSLITEPPPHSLIHEQKILELTNRITDLLSGEVPVRCQDVVVYFSIEEWEYLEEHKDLYKDIMMENHQSLTSPDGSSQRNPPESCPSPLCPQDCPEEKQNVPLDHQDVIMENNQPLTSLDGSMQKNPPERCPSPLYSQDCPEEKPNFALDYHELKIENHQTLISLDGSSQRNPPERCPSPLYSQDCPEEKQNVLLYDQESDGSGRTSGLENPTSVSATGEDRTRGSRGHDIENNQSQTGRKRRGPRVEKAFPCSECGKCFNFKSHLVEHQRSHTGEKPYACSECGKCYSQKSKVLKHLQFHIGEKPYSCAECGKCFTQKSCLVKHQRIHTGEKPFSCLECGRCFTLKPNLQKHLRTHTGEKPFSCNECGKCFTQKTHLVRHQSVHT
ncbi:zinc finger protein 793-like isoform X5 [Bufo bufo]|uniref:zinc finger protein 793-like isoform X5 n=1 Tax=Bufo bufo TaxID=8384 RepID=UPI001ABE238A|nr:zinc finger protein 793-like isoform X5 [Bufo bufo]